MNPVEAAVAFLRFVEQEVPRDSSEALGMLVRLLDVLALSAHSSLEVSSGVPSGEEPIFDYDSTREMVVRSFPFLGYYRAAAPMTVGGDMPQDLVGDAVDDLADVVLSLRGVLWSAENEGAKVAHGRFRSSFTSHWGTHLRSLQLYLHQLPRGEVEGGE